MAVTTSNAVACLLAVTLLVAPIARDAVAGEVIRLTVPYVRQARALCGAAAAAMVFRYWGDERADMNEFAALLDREAGGLATDVLAKAIDDRGWRVVQFTGSIEAVTNLLRDGRPVIVLLEERNERYHYVVVVGVSDTGVVIHDPGREPGRSVSFKRFMDAWEPAGLWALLVLPPPGVER